MTNMFSNAVWTVGKAVRNMASSVLDWNTSTFSGAVDIIVVRHRTENGFIYKCTPFHVKFGILQVLKSSERVVNIEINGQPSPLKMKLSKNGFAYFADEEDWYCESVEEDVVSENSESSGKTKENKENNLRRVKSLTDIVKIKREKDYPKSIEHANKYSNQIEDRLQIRFVNFCKFGHSGSVVMTKCVHSCAHGFESRCCRFQTDVKMGGRFNLT
ncbi:Lipin-3, variant 3 [Bonamia ostreae]|uniref:Lipin-3, variant 3 n=1 Tax=Bonamia ostreae TaxID=126728 RepID=A0ABV2AI08_9EUKA